MRINMKVDNIYELIKEVSKLGASSLEYEEDGSRISVEFSGNKDKKLVDNIVNEEIHIEKEEKTYIKSPIVGTFYTSGDEGGKPYVNEGDVVNKGDIVAILEAMKLMNELKSEYSGTIVEVMVKNGESVEYGQPLFEISRS